MTLGYTADAWARMAEHPGDRTAEMRSLVESLGGSLDYLRWEIGVNSAYAIFDLPDGVQAKAAELVLFKTGAYEHIEMHELYPQPQLIEVLTLANDAASVYQVPGEDALRNP